MNHLKEVKEFFRVTLFVLVAFVILIVCSMLFSLISIAIAQVCTFFYVSTCANLDAQAIELQKSTTSLLEKISDNIFIFLLICMIAAGLIMALDKFTGKGTLEAKEG